MFDFKNGELFILIVSNMVLAKMKSRLPNYIQLKCLSLLNVQRLTILCMISTLLILVILVASQSTQVSSCNDHFITIMISKNRVEFSW